MRSSLTRRCPRRCTRACLQRSGGRCTSDIASPCLLRRSRSPRDCARPSTYPDESAKLGSGRRGTGILLARTQAAARAKWRTSMNMNAQQLIVMAIVGIVAGWLASLVVGGGGIIRYLITGIIGAFIGGWLFNVAGWKLNLGNEIAEQIVTAAVGAIILVLLARLVA